MSTSPAAPLSDDSPDGLRDRLVWNQLARLGLIFAFVVAGAALSLLVYAFLAICCLAQS